MESRSDPKLANLQDFAVFQRVSRAFKGIRPTGKGSGPLPAIDFKRNLQNQGLVWGGWPLGCAFGHETQSACGRIRPAQ
jgi:hypothetical protein